MHLQPFIVYTSAPGFAELVWLAHLHTNIRHKDILTHRHTDTDTQTDTHILTQTDTLTKTH